MPTMRHIEQHNVWGASMTFESQSADLQRMLTELIAEALERVGTAKAPAPAANSTPNVLTPREHEVLERIASGESNKVIARSLGLSLHTVKRHVANILT